MRAHFTTLKLLLAGAACVPAIALAASGGSSGSGSLPSASAPSFDPAAEYRKGVDALQGSRFGDAKSAFAKVLSTAPRDANTNYLAGLADAGLGDLKAARRHYERAVKSDGDLVAARQELALTYVKLGDRAKAEEQLAELKKSSDKCGGSCAKAGDIDKAVAAVSGALGGAPAAALETKPGLLFASASGDKAYLEAVSLINEHRYQAAIESLERARTAFGVHPDILTYLGFANRKLGRYDVARGYYEQALAIDPHHRGATEYYGELMVERGDVAGAGQMLAKLDAICTFGCAEADELRRWIDAGREPAS